MHGVPNDLDLTHFRNEILEQISLGQFIIHFIFSGDSPRIISVEGHWELLDKAGQILDQQQEPEQRACYRLHVLLGKEVVGSEVHAPESFVLLFNSGHKLCIYDDSKVYESFSIQPGNVYV